jgi:hypothetical protein
MRGPKSLRSVMKGGQNPVLLATWHTKKKRLPAKLIATSP